MKPRIDKWIDFIRIVAEMPLLANSISIALATLETKEQHDAFKMVIERIYITIRNLKNI